MSENMELLEQPHYKIDDPARDSAFREIRIWMFHSIRDPNIVRCVEFNKADSDVLCYKLWRGQMWVEDGLRTLEPRPKTIYFHGTLCVLDQPETKIVLKDRTDKMRETFVRLAAQGWSEG